MVPRFCRYNSGFRSIDYTSDVRSGKKTLQKNVPIRNCLPTKDHGFLAYVFFHVFSFWLSHKFPQYFCRSWLKDFLITFVVKIYTTQVSFVVNLDSGFHIFLQLLQAASAPQASFIFSRSLRGSVEHTCWCLAMNFCMARLCTKTILNDPRRSLEVLASAYNW